jgi:hypothetical protein
MDAKRLEISRLINRFAFGPRPGEFAAALKAGPANYKSALLNPPAVDSGAPKEPVFADLGPRPEPKSADSAQFSQALGAQKKELTLCVEKRCQKNQMLNGEKKQLAAY